MANTVQIKRSAVPGKVPTIGQLALGELAVNTFDGKLYLRVSNGTDFVRELGADATLLGGQLPSYYLNWSNLTNLPTTLSGYGITDAAPLSHNHSATQITSGTLSVARLPALTGDITSAAGSATTTIGDGVVSLAKLATIPTATILGRQSAGTGAVQTLSITNLKSMLAFTADDIGLGNVQNVALSTWTGSSNITSLGNITGGTWNGTVIAANKGGTGLASYTTGNFLVAASSTSLGQRTPEQVRVAIGAKKFTSSETSPSNPIAGDEWHVPSTFTTYTWYVDANSSQWVEMGPPSISGSDPSQSDLKESFETVSRNLKCYPAQMVYTGDVLASVEYTLPTGTVTKALSYSDDRLVAVHLSGDLPAGIATTKALSYTGNTLTGTTYT